MTIERIYSIRENRIRQGAMEGFCCGEDGTLCCTGEKTVHTLFLKSIDGMEEGCLWGRLSLQAAVAENMVYYVHAFASDSRDFLRKGVLTGLDGFLLDAGEPAEDKRLLYRQQGALRFINQEDMLLYELEGRYLFLFLEAVGSGGGSFRSIRLDLDGDRFMRTFPQVYQERNSFLHRFLSVFSSLYQDFAEQIEQADRLLDADSAPTELLPELGAWLGMDLNGNFLEEKKLRLLVGEAGRLSRKKGTKEALERLTEIVLGERAVILERNVMEEYLPPGEREQYGRLYGDTPWDVTMLIRVYVPESQRAQLLFLLEQFKPVRSRMRLVFLEDCGVLDFYGYLDVNAVVFGVRGAALDNHCRIDGTGVLDGDWKECAGKKQQEEKKGTGCKR